MEPTPFSGAYTFHRVDLLWSFLPPLNEEWGLCLDREKLSNITRSVLRLEKYLTSGVKGIKCLLYWLRVSPIYYGDYCLTDLSRHNTWTRLTEVPYRRVWQSTDVFQVSIEIPFFTNQPPTPFRRVLSFTYSTHSFRLLFKKGFIPHNLFTRTSVPFVVVLLYHDKSLGHYK